MAPKEQYSRADVRRQFGVTERQLRSWERQDLIAAAESYSFSDLIAVKTIVKLRENHIPARQIGEALASLRRKLDWVKEPLTELRIVSDGRKISVHVAGQKMEAISGQILFDFDAAALGAIASFPEKKRSAQRLRESEEWFQRGLDAEESGLSRELRRDLSKLDGLHGVDFDLAFVHTVAGADPDAGCATRGITGMRALG